MSKGTKFFAVIIVLVGIAAYFAFSRWRSDIHNPDGIMQVRGISFQVEIPKGEAAMQMGLGDRDSLAENHGMLFIFSTVGNYPFWMKRMRIPIDIVWIRGEEVVGTSENLEPEPGVPDAQLKYYYPPDPMDKALEVPAGTVAREGIKVGDSATMVSQ